jgi:hypothetical protein
VAFAFPTGCSATSPILLLLLVHQGQIARPPCKLTRSEPPLPVEMSNPYIWKFSLSLLASNYWVSSYTIDNPVSFPDKLSLCVHFLFQHRQARMEICKSLHIFLFSSSNSSSYIIDSHLVSCVLSFLTLTCSIQNCPKSCAFLLQERTVVLEANGPRIVCVSVHEVSFLALSLLLSLVFEYLLSSEISHK